MNINDLKDFNAEKSRTKNFVLLLLIPIKKPLFTSNK